MSFAIIKTGGKQYKISEGDSVTIEKLSTSKKTLKEGDKIVFDEVLLFDDGNETLVGEPTLSGITVEAKLEEEGKGKKISIIKFKSKSRYKRKMGHRQPYAKVSISKMGKGTTKKAPAKTVAKKTTAKKTTKK